MKYFAPVAAFLLTIMGSLVFKDRQYYFICLAIVVAILVPFVFSLEKTKERTLVVIGALAALSAVSRVAFSPVPQFKPMVAIVILSGICLGAQKGFAVGAVGAFASNMYFGQGPWTPWQMFAMGIVGFLAGKCFGKKRPNIVVISVFGFIITVVAYGVIMDLSTVVMTYDKPALGQVVATLSMGVYFNIIHGLSTLGFLLIGGKPIIKRLDRIVKKYGV